jgi:hypothetical protein|nr:hypothetical protein [Kofleriaceae bacterium]
MTNLRALFAIAVIAGCGGSHDSTPSPDAGGTAILPGFTVPAAPANGMQIILPIVKDLQPGSSTELCTYTGIQAQEDLQIRSVDAVQAQSGHHVALWYSKVNMPAGTTHPCSDADMVNFRFIAGATNNASTAVPGQLVLVIPKGTYIAIQQHYINASDNVVDSQSVLNINYADPGGSYTTSSAMAFLDDTLSLAPGGDTMNIHCTMQQDVDAWFVMPHMHKYGVSFTATLTHAGSASQLVDVPTWDPDYEFSAPQTTWDPSTPQKFLTGDTIDVQCNWDNTTAKTLKFGDEMCVFFAQTIDTAGRGNIACDGGAWVPF